MMLETRRLFLRSLAFVAIIVSPQTADCMSATRLTAFVGFCGSGDRILRQSRAAILPRTRFMSSSTQNRPSTKDENDGTPSPVLELEQKFEISPETPGLLKELGFKKTKEVSMADWYWDYNDQQSSSSFPLIRRDTWLRYREPLSKSSRDSKGRWELKLGTAGMNQKGAQKTTTAYQEFVGEDAFDTLKTLNLPIYNKAESPAAASSPQGDVEYKGLAVPQLPEGVHLDGLVPFARIVTHRSSWTRDSQPNDEKGNNEVSVDLDMTDFDYNVGEVEIVITPSKQQDSGETVEKSQKIIGDWIEKLSQNPGGKQSKGPAMGKLEYFLQTQKPEIFAILREANLVA